MCLPHSYYFSFPLSISCVFFASLSYDASSFLRPNTLIGGENLSRIRFFPFLAMTHFDVSEVQQEDQTCIAFLEQNQLQHSQNIISQGYTHQSPPSHLPQPPPFLGVASDLLEFNIKFYQFPYGNSHTHNNPQSQLLYVCSLLTGSARQWYRAHVVTVKE